MNNFKNLSPGDYPYLKQFFVLMPYRLSIYSLSSLICWNNENHRTRWSIIDDYFVTVTEANGDGCGSYMILPLHQHKEPTPTELRKMLLSLGLKEMRHVPEDYLNRFSEELKNSFLVAEEKKYSDYIYKTDDLSNLAGRRYAKKRNHLKHFLVSFVESGRVSHEPVEAANLNDCLAFIEAWCEEYDCEGQDDDSLLCERQALETALTHMKELEYCGLVIRIDGVVSALTVTSRLNENMGVLNFEKAFVGIDGLYQYVDRECARTCLAPYEYSNKESDMGLPGLAQSKNSYYPCERVNSYRLVLL